MVNHSTVCRIHAITLQQFLRVSGILGVFFTLKGKMSCPHDKTSKVACARSNDSYQPGYPPSQIRVFTVRMKKAWILSYPLSSQRRLWSDWVDAQAGLSLRWAHMPFCWFSHEAAQMFISNICTVFGVFKKLVSVTSVSVYTWSG